jgi:hypothetical protein
VPRSLDSLHFGVQYDWQRALASSVNCKNCVHVDAPGQLLLGSLGTLSLVDVLMPQWLEMI